MANVKHPAIVAARPSRATAHGEEAMCRTNMRTSLAFMAQSEDVGSSLSVPVQQT